MIKYLYWTLILIHLSGWWCRLLSFFFKHNWNKYIVNQKVTHILCGHHLNDTLKNDTGISRRYAVKDTARLEISMSFVHILQDIATNVHNTCTLRVTFLVEYTSTRVGSRGVLARVLKLTFEMLLTKITAWFIKKMLGIMDCSLNAKTFSLDLCSQRIWLGYNDFMRPKGDLDGSSLNGGWAACPNE